MFFGSIFNNGWGGQDIIIGRRRKAGPKFMGSYPAWVRAFIVFAFAYTIHQHGFAVTPSMKEFILLCTETVSYVTSFFHSFA